MNNVSAFDSGNPAWRSDVFQLSRLQRYLSTSAFCGASQRKSLMTFSSMSDLMVFLPSHLHSSFTWNLSSYDSRRSSLACLFSRRPPALWICLYSPHSRTSDGKVGTRYFGPRDQCERSCFVFQCQYRYCIPSLLVLQSFDSSSDFDYAAHGGMTTS